MAWVIEDWIISNVRKSSNLVTVEWVQKNDGDATQKKRGSFTHTIDADKTDAVNRSDIDTKVLADEGVRS